MRFVEKYAMYGSINILTDKLIRTDESKFVVVVAVVAEMLRLLRLLGQKACLSLLSTEVTKLISIDRYVCKKSCEK